VTNKVRNFWERKPNEPKLFTKNISATDAQQDFAGTSFVYPNITIVREKAYKKA
jgi:hypothetical protein